MDITQLLTFTAQNGASDLHISAGVPPRIRSDGALRELDVPALTNRETHQLLYAVMNDKQRKEFEKNLELDFSFELVDIARFRVNVFQHNRGMGGVFRVIAETVLTLEQLNYPAILKTICDLPNGLVLVTGPTGSGKSTGLAAMIDYINKTRREHILTIEDPIEFVHTSQKALVNQRELHAHTHSFENSLKAALREDPDVILVGEMRDLETIRLALTAAETGHLVFGTLHTINASKTIHRIVDVFPGDEKGMVRAMLSETLRAVVSQTLLPKIGGGRVAAQEILVCNAAVRNLVREDKIAQIYSSMQTGGAEGMQTLDAHLQELVKNKLVSPESAAKVAVDKKLFSGPAKN
jgi:twitching motility protein PilT